MTIPFKNYVDISSALLSAGSIPGAVFELRLITDNPLTPTQNSIQFTSAAAVGEYYGTTSDEYLQSVYYFSYVRPTFLTSPSSISFTFWPEIAEPPKIFGVVGSGTLGDFTTISDGSISLTLNSETNELSGLDFTTALSLADVATVIQDAVQAASIDPLWTAAQVIYTDRFELMGGVAGLAVVDAAPGGVGTDISILIGWTSSAVFSFGSNVQTLTAFLDSMTSQNNNFGSFAFTFTPTTSQVIEAATWNSLDLYRFAFCERTTDTDVTGYVTALSGTQGVGVPLTLYDEENIDDFPWLLPAAIFASVNFTHSNTVPNYMFKFNGSLPTVTNSATSPFQNNTYYDDLRINYIGLTQENGEFLAFYQRGFCVGLDNGSQVGIGVYTNEVWLNRTAGTAVANVLLDTPSVPANSRGVALVTSALQPVIEQALFNGTISVGNVFNNTKKAQIAAITGDELAWVTVQTDGYYFSVFVVEVAPDEFEIEYLLVYAKNNSVRKITGRHAIA